VVLGRGRFLAPKGPGPQRSWGGASAQGNALGAERSPPSPALKGRNPEAGAVRE